MSLPGGIRTTLAVALLLIVGGALGGAYLMVVPSLERRLVDERLDELQTRRGGDRVLVHPGRRARRLQRAAGASTASPTRRRSCRTRASSSTRSSGPSPCRCGRSRTPPPTRRARSATTPVGLETAAGLAHRPRPCRARAAGRSPRSRCRSSRATCCSSRRRSRTSSRRVRVVKRRLLYATGVALAIAAILGSAAATLHARRIRRLERAANRIAEGEFDEPVVDLGDDELGELAAAFERMRVQLAQLDTARKEFVANASHELRTPLFSLAGFLELMADEDLDEETRAGFLATTREQVERLTKLAADLLDLSRMDAGPAARRAGGGRARRRWRGCSSTSSRPLAEATGHALDAGGRRRRRGRSPTRSASSRSAARSSRTRSPTRRRAPRSSSRRRCARRSGGLAVSDDGPGIPPEHAERVFDRFYRVEGPHASGSGLGLAIARELAEHMDGTVELSGARRGGRRSRSRCRRAAVPAAELAVST